MKKKKKRVNTHMVLIMRDDNTRNKWNINQYLEFS